MSRQKDASQRSDRSGSTGKLFVVGIGPGGPPDRTLRAEQAITSSRVVVGYKRYLDLVRDLTKGKELISSGMKAERERCRAALEKAVSGTTVALVSSGDAGIYGMAGLAVEMASSLGINVPIEIVPGVTAASALAAKVGAPLMLDFACISLSDLLVPWKKIEQRLEAVAQADLVVALYNPKSKKRATQLEQAAEIFRKYRPDNTPVAIGTALGTDEEVIVLSDLERFLSHEINMRSVVIIGNRSSRVIQGLFVTPRGYRL
ncbi:MAG: precorrin-3B C(17)-methyltransferase [Desulfomonile sp.]|nr:precorrin-3B C(17)-methyltransferase [Desulfomonile sp.]